MQCNYSAVAYTRGCLESTNLKHRSSLQGHPAAAAAAAAALLCHRSLLEINLWAALVPCTQDLVLAIQAVALRLSWHVGDRDFAQRSRFECLH